MNPIHLKQFPYQLALSLAAVFATILCVSAWPILMKSPAVLAVSELVGFALVVGLARRLPAFRHHHTTLLDHADARAKLEFDAQDFQAPVLEGGEMMHFGKRMWIHGRATKTTGSRPQAEDPCPDRRG